MRRPGLTLAEEQAAMRRRMLGPLAPIEEPKVYRANIQYFREQHVSIPELAEAWGMSRKTLRRVFEGETEGVIRIGADRVTMFVSESAARRVYLKWTRNRPLVVPHDRKSAKPRVLASWPPQRTLD